MSDIQVVIKRLRDDPVFRDTLNADPGAALRGYDLTTTDLEILVHQLSGLETGDQTGEHTASEHGTSALFDRLLGHAEDPSGADEVS